MIAYTTSLFTDCVYSNKPLADNLKRIFGSSLLYGYNSNLGPKNDVKVVITATTTKPGALTLSNCAQRVTVPQRGDGDSVEGIKVWEA